MPGAAAIGTDTLARPLSKALGQNVMVENRPGAGTVVGTEVAARSPGDGHTVPRVANSFTINPAVRSRLPYEALKDFTAFACNPIVPYAYRSAQWDCALRSFLSCERKGRNQWPAL